MGIARLVKPDDDADGGDGSGGGAVWSWWRIFCPACGDNFGGSAEGRENDDEGNGVNDDRMLKLNQRCWICPKFACFGTADSGRAVHCRSHKTSVEVDVVHLATRCPFKGCEKQGRYGMPTVRRPGAVRRGLFCAEHRKNGQEDIISPRCTFAGGCKKRATFGNGTRAVSCAEHRDAENRADLRHGLCTAPLCTKRASFGTNGRATACAAHKLAGYVDVQSRFCSYAEGCTIRARGLCSFHRKAPAMGAAENADARAARQINDTGAVLPSSHTKSFGPVRGLLSVEEL
jgi:hypothetical protein